MDDDDQPDDVVDEVEPKIILTRENIEEGLSQLYRVPSKYINITILHTFSFSDPFACLINSFFLNIDGESMVWGTITCEEKDPPVQNIQDVNEKSLTYGQCELLKYQHARVLKLNTNALTSIEEIVSLNYLLELQAKSNQITDINFMAASNDTLLYLQKVDLSINKITSLPKMKCPSLFSLTIDENEIASADLFGHSALRVLSMNKNKMTNCKGLANLSALVELNIQENEIVSLEGLCDLPELKKLNLTNNKLESLASLSSLESLEVLVLEGNPIAKVSDLIELNKLPNLIELNMNGCVITDEKGDDFKKEILIACERLTKLKIINGNEITDEDRQEAMVLKEERI